MSRLAYLVLTGLVFLSPQFAGVAFVDDLTLASLSRGDAAAGPALCTAPGVPVRGASCAAPMGVEVAQSGAQSCGCQPGQACCTTVCCPASHPHYCPGGQCWQTISDAQAACGNGFEVCGVPQ